MNIHIHLKVGSRSVAYLGPCYSPGTGPSAQVRPRGFEAQEIYEYS